MRHAERNAIKFASPEKLKGATLYVNAFPCEACALEIADSGITRVVVMTPKSNDPNSTINANRELSEAILAQKNMQMTLIGWMLPLLGHNPELNYLH
jgi:dCMP deaminase